MAAILLVVASIMFLGVMGLFAYLSAKGVVSFLTFLVVIGSLVVVIGLTIALVKLFNLVFPRKEGQSSSDGQKKEVSIVELEKELAQYLQRQHKDRLTRVTDNIIRHEGGSAVSEIFHWGGWGKTNTRYDCLVRLNNTSRRSILIGKTKDQVDWAANNLAEAPARERRRIETYSDPLTGRDRTVVEEIKDKIEKVAEVQSGAAEEKLE